MAEKTPKEASGTRYGRGRVLFMLQIETIKAAILRGEPLSEIHKRLGDRTLGYTMFTVYAKRYCARELKIALGREIAPAAPLEPSPKAEPEPASIPRKIEPLTAGPKVAAAPAQKKFSVSPVLPPKDQLV